VIGQLDFLVRSELGSPSAEGLDNNTRKQQKGNSAMPAASEARLDIVRATNYISLGEVVVAAAVWAGADILD
jgi:hypothetical protein